MLHNSEIVDNIIEEIHEMQDWITISAALGANEINSNFASRDDILSIVNAALSDSRVYIGTIETGTPNNYLTPIPPETTPASIVDDILKDPDEVIHSMMDYFIAESGM